MRTFTINGRQYRTDGRKSPISGRLLLVESLRDDGGWKSVKNVTHREQVLALLESAAAPCRHPTKISSCGIKVCMDCGEPLNGAALRLSKVLAA